MAQPDPAALIKKAVKAFGLDVTTVAPVPESHSSIVRVLTLRSGEKLVLKLPWNLTKFERECNALKLLAKVPLAPRLLDQYSDKAGHAAMLMTCLPGQPVKNAQACSPRLAGQIGEALARMHSKTMPELKGEKPDRDWWGAMTATVRGALDRCRAHQAHRDWDRVEKVFLAAVADFPKPRALKFAHFDFRLGNLLQVDGQLSGVVDFESSRNGSPDFDLAEICLVGWERSPALKRAMLRGYGRIRAVPALLELTTPVYGLYQSLARVNWCLKRNDTKGSFYTSNRRALRSFVRKVGREI